MSTLKIVGTESELRLDCSTKDGKDFARFSEDDGPNHLVDKALDISSAAPAISRESYLNKISRFIRTGKIAKNIDKKKGFDNSIEGIVSEHISRDRDLKPSTSRRKANLQLRGFTGGYTPSGHRIYVDGSHPEICTPECSNPLDLVCWEKAGEFIMTTAAKILSETESINFTLYKDNSDGYGNSWGNHENYLVDTNLFHKLTSDDEISQALWITFLVTRIIYTGSGKVGYDENHKDLFYGKSANRFPLLRQLLLSQRTEFLTELVSQSTTVRRPWINTRDISYVGGEYGSRLHVIVGDANRCEMAMYLKIGMSMMVLMMLEDGYRITKWPVIPNIIKSAAIVNEDVSFNGKINAVIDGKYGLTSAIIIQKIILENAFSWYESICKNEYPKEKIEWMPPLLNKLSLVLECLSNSEEDKLFGQIDWVTKFVLIKGLLDKIGLSYNDFLNGNTHSNGREPSEIVDYVKSVDKAYHKLGERGLYSKIMLSGDEIEKIIDDNLIIQAVINPPSDTRAFNRGLIIREYGELIQMSNWSFLSCGYKDLFLSNPWRE